MADYRKRFKDEWRETKEHWETQIKEHRDEFNLIGLTIAGAAIGAPQAGVSLYQIQMQKKALEQAEKQQKIYDQLTAAGLSSGVSTAIAEPLAGLTTLGSGWQYALAAGAIGLVMVLYLTQKR